MNDTFSDGSYTNQALPGSADWHVGGPNPNMSVSPTGLTFADANNDKATAMAYFTPTDLAVGASLKLSFNYSFTQTATSANDFMFGLYNSGGSQLTKDSSNNFGNDKIFNSYTGYAASGVFGTDPSGTGSDHIEARNLTGSSLLSIDSYTQGTSYKQSGAATPGQIYQASLSIARTATGITVQSQIGNTTMTQTYTSGMFTKFDAVGIFSNGNSGSFTMDNIQLDYVGAPEPSTFYALALFGVSIFGKAALGKSRKALTLLLPRLVNA